MQNRGRFPAPSSLCFLRPVMRGVMCKMDMKRDAVQNELHNLLGQRISFKRIAGNTIILYFGGKPGDINITTLRIDPSWRYLKNNKWVLGSGDLPWEKEEKESKEDYSNRFNQLCSASDNLNGAVINNISINQNSSDLRIDISNSQQIVSFSPFLDEENWVYRNRGSGLTICASVNGFEHRSIK